MAAGFRPALQARGVPLACYLDNGSPFVDAWLLRACGVLGVKLIHSRPGKPEGRGKIERFFRTVRDQFLVEAGDGAGIRDLAEMNRLFQAWLETAYHQAVHSETGEAPAGRWEKATPAERAVPEPALLRGAFLWSERRKAGKPALARLHGSVSQAGAWLAGRTVELVFDPFDLDRIEVRLGGKPAGTAVPFVMGRHRHPKTRTPDGQARTEPAPTGIDYLGALGGVHDEALREQVSYQFLIGGPRGPAQHGEPDDPEEEGGGGRAATPGQGGRGARRGRGRRAARRRRGHRPGRRRQRRLAVPVRCPGRRGRPGPRPRQCPAAARRRQRRPRRARRSRRSVLMIDAVGTRFGLARLPLGRDLPPSRLPRHRDCREAAPRIAWAVSEKTIPMLPGEASTRKHVAI